MSSIDPESRKRSQQLSLALRAVRRARQMTSREIATGMGIPLRSYLHFEAGGGRLNVDLVLRFAQATDSDPYAILGGALIGAPDLAGHCARNKMMIALAIALQEFCTELGPDIERLETSTLVTAFSELFTGLASQARPQEDWAQKWLADKAPSVGVAPRRGGEPPDENS